MSDVVQVGERVVLRFPQESDRRAYLSLLRHSWDFLKPWQPTPPPDTDPFDSVVFDRVFDASWTERRRGLFLVDKETDRLLGCVNFNEIVRGVFQNCYLGYWIGKAYTGRGYMTEGLGLGLSYAFGELNLHRVEANVIPENLPSIALVQRLGFRKEGLSTKYLKIAGRWQDHEGWAMTIDDWQAHTKG